jgi:hypothetical protein
MYTDTVKELQNCPSGSFLFWGVAVGSGGIALSTYFTVRGQSYFSGLPKYWPSIPLSARRECTPRLCCGGRTDSPGGEGDGGGSIFWKTREIGLPSYSKICTLCGIVYDIVWMGCSRRKPWKMCVHLYAFVSYRRLSAQLQFSLSAVNLGYGIQYISMSATLVTRSNSCLPLLKVLDRGGCH